MPVVMLEPGPVLLNAPKKESRDIIVIPARMESVRLPGKPMLMAAGRPLVRWTYERAKLCRQADHVIVATPDREIGRYCEDHGMLWRPTREDHPTGTHRCAEVLEQIEQGGKVKVGAVVNWQVDEPQVDHNTVGELIDRIGGRINIVTPTCDSAMHRDREEDSNVVRVAVGETGRCLWFSRAPMRGSRLHVGVYAFSARALRGIGRREPTRLSLAESLEQLAWIEHEWDVRSLDGGRFPGAINTPEDWERFRQAVEEAGEP